MTVDRAKDGEYGSKAFETIPPEAAATTDETIGSNHADATDSGVCLCRENLKVSVSSCHSPRQDSYLHHEDHAKVDKDGNQDIDPP
jgi:hypothetical protein